MNFDRVADIYDATRAIPDAWLERIADTILAATHATSSTRFLEIGVGTGRIAMPIARRGHSYTGIDISEKMMAVLRNKARSAGVDIQLVNGDITTLPFADGSFDVVIGVHILHLVPEWQTVLDEVWRVLTPQGLLVIGSESGSERDRYSHLRRQWAESVREEGGDLARRHGTWARIEEYLTEKGCYLVTYRAARWEEEFVPLELLEAMRARTFSQSWAVPDDVLDRAHERMVRWGEEQLGDLSLPQRSAEDFLVMVVPGPPT